jgi:hypothetical protein
MRRVWAAAALSLFCSGARADEAAYLAARDRSIATFARLEKSGKSGDAIFKKQEQELAALEKLLRPLIGDVSVGGFSKDGKISLETISGEDVGFQQLDGLVFAGDDGKASLLVTTKGLAEAWLRVKSHKEDSAELIPNSLHEALKSENFYTFALSSDAGVSKYADVTIAAPAGAEFAFAMLDARSQDLAPPAPDELTIALVSNGRVYLVTAPPQGKIEPIPVCVAQAKETEAKAQAKFSAFQASKPRNEKLYDEYTALEKKGDEDNRKCFAERAKGESFFAGVRDQAQALVDRLAKK